MWNFIKGYVIIEVKGAQLERFLNMTIHHEIHLWDIKKEGNLTASVGVNQFKKLKPIAKKTASKIKIVKKIGTPFFIFKHRKRKILLLGTLFFFISLYFMTAFIWDIEIKGYKNIEYDYLMEHLNENGLRLGTFRRSINRFEIENSMLSNFDISFINLELTGTRAIITIDEIKQAIEQKVEQRSEIRATKTGIIESITVAHGEAVIIPGQIVKKGDLLVTGYITQETWENFFMTYAEASILAYVNYSLQFSLPKETEKPYYTGKTRDLYNLNLFGIYINFINLFPKFDFYDTIVSRRMLNFGENYPLPIILITNTMREYENKRVVRSEKELENAARLLITEHTLATFDISVDIIDKEISFIHTEHGIEVSALITTLEEIGG